VAGDAAKPKRGLRNAADRRSLGLVAFHLALIVTACVVGQRAAWLALFVPLLIASSFVQLILVHNAMHTPLFYGKRWNRVWQCTLSMCIGFPVSIYVPVHNLSHHLGLQTPRDVLRTTEVRHRWNLANLVHHMVMGTVHLHILHVAYLNTMRRTHPRWLAQVLVELATVLTYFVTVGFAAGPFVALAVLASNVGGQLLMVGFGYVQHDGCDAASEYNHSRNFLSPIFNWVICDNGYHTAHHNKPGLHWSRGREAHARDVAPHMHPGLDERSLISYMWRTFVWPGRRLNYDGTPVVITEPRARRELWTPPSAERVGASSGAVEG
jgi:fatty acid desaturase